MNVPSFGNQIDTVDYKKRVGAYIIVIKKLKKEIILVQAPNGAYFLPGGEIENGETKKETIDRELIEELGFTTTIDYYIGQTNEYFFSRHRNQHYYHPGYFFVAKYWEKIAEPLEKNNTLRWVPVEQGIDLLKRGSHKWAVTQWLKDCKKHV